MTKPEPIFSEIDNGVQLGLWGDNQDVIVKGNCETAQATLDALAKLNELKGREQ